MDRSNLKVVRCSDDEPESAELRQARIWELVKIIAANQSLTAALGSSEDLVMIASMIENEFSKATEEYV